MYIHIQTYFSLLYTYTRVCVCVYTVSCYREFVVKINEDI